MDDRNAIIQPWVANRATPTIQQDLGISNSAWDSAVEKRAISSKANIKASDQVVSRTNGFKTFIKGLVPNPKVPELNALRLENCTIAHVQREANEALEAYEQRGSSYKKHFFRTAGRNFSNNASTTEALLLFLPSGDYTSVLCGALTLVFKAAKRIADVREQILDCLGTLTRTVDGTNGYQYLYSGDLKLWTSAENLYIALLDAVQEILVWLNKGAWRRSFGAVFKQEESGKTLENKIKYALETKVKEFFDQLEYCQHERIQEIQFGVDGIARSVYGLADDMHKGQAIEQKHHEESMSLQRKIYEDSMGLLMALCHERLSVFDWRQKTSPELQKAVAQVAHRDYDHIVMVTAKPQLISATNLLGILGVNTSVVGDDLRLAVQYGQNMSPGKQARAASLLRNARFQTWLKSGQCEFLVVNGKDLQSASSTMSSLTYVVGLLEQALTTTNTARPLVCICGRHTSSDDPLDGAPGVLRLLIYQLLTYTGDSADLSLVDYNFIEAVKAGDIRYLRELFRSIVVSILVNSDRPCSIVCLVDNVSLLETAARAPGLESLIAFLQQLVLDLNDLGGLLVFKVLLTYPYMSRFAQDWFPPETILTLGEDLGVDRQGYHATRLAQVSADVVTSPASYPS